MDSVKKYQYIYQFQLTKCDFLLIRNMRVIFASESSRLTLFIIFCHNNQIQKRIIRPINKDSILYSHHYNQLNLVFCSTHCE